MRPVWGGMSSLYIWDRLWMYHHHHHQPPPPRLANCLIESVFLIVCTSSAPARESGVLIV